MEEREEQQSQVLQPELMIQMPLVEQAPQGPPTAHLMSFRSSRWLLLFVFFLQFLVGELISTFWSFVFPGPVPQYVRILLVQLFAVVLPCVVYLMLYDDNPKQVFKLRFLTGKTTWRCVIIGVCAQPIASLCNMPVMLHIEQKFGATIPAAISTPGTVGQLLLGLLVVGLVPAVCEELLMRGIVLHTTEYKGYRSSLVLTALLFALLHNNPANFFGLFVLGLITCYAVWMTQSIFAGIVVHFSFNAFGMVLDYLISRYLTNAPWLGGYWFAGIVAFFSVLLLGQTTAQLGKTKARRYRTQGFWRQLFGMLFSPPVLLILLGYWLFDYMLRFTSL